MLAACGRVLGKTMDQMLDESIEALAIKQHTTVQGLTGGYGSDRPAEIGSTCGEGTTDRAARSCVP
jgi:hypothetical protein